MNAVQTHDTGLIFRLTGDKSKFVEKQFTRFVIVAENTDSLR